MDTFISQKPTETRALVKVCEKNGFCVFPALLDHTLEETVQSQKCSLGTVIERFSEKVQQSWILSKVYDIEGNHLATNIEVQECQIIQKPTVERFGEHEGYQSDSEESKTLPGFSVLTETWQDKVSSLKNQSETMECCMEFEHFQILENVQETLEYAKPPAYP